VVLAGPSGVGKGAIVSRLLAARPDLRLSISATTRPPRPAEVEGRDYYFVAPHAFDKLIASGGLLEWAEIFGNRYGTPREPVDRALEEGRSVVTEVDVQGARQIRAARPDAFLVFIRPPSLQELERRLRTRDTETDEQLRRRLDKASEELAAEPEFDAAVVNDDLDEAAGKVIDIVSRLSRVP
jgi:guanylate kinase